MPDTLTSAACVILNVLRQSSAAERRQRMPRLALLLLQHFRATCEPGVFYSVPKQYFDAVPVAEATQALAPYTEIASKGVGGLRRYRGSVGLAVGWCLSLSCMSFVVGLCIHGHGPFDMSQHQLWRS